MAVDSMRRPVGINVGPRARLARLSARSQNPRAQGVPRTRQKAQSGTLQALGKKVDRFERRVVQHMNRAETRIVDKLHQKEQLDLQRIEDEKIGWSQSILARCFNTIVGAITRNIPLIVSMFLSVEVASGAATGGLALGISLGVAGAVALVVLLWQAYKTIKAYRAMKAAQRAAAAADGPAADGAAAPRRPRLTLRQRCGVWCSHIKDFIRFAVRRGIR